MKYKEVTEINDDAINQGMKIMYKIANRMSLGDYWLKDEFVSIGYVGLAKGLKTYEFSKGKFSAYIGTCVANEIRMSFRKKRPDIISFEKGLVTDSGFKVLSCLTDESTPEDIIIYRELLKLITDESKDVLTDKEYYILRTLLYNPDTTQSVMAAALGVSRSYVSRLVQSTKTKLIKLMRKRGYYVSPNFK